MNFNYSYRAFLITSLLFGILLLALWSINISSEIPESFENVPVEYAEFEEEETQELAKNIQKDKIRIETNRAYNEAEEFIRKSENEQDLLSEEPLQNQFIEAPAIDISDATKNALAAIKERLKNEERKRSQNKKVTSNTKKGSNRKTTIRYSLKNRNAMSLPNPVYTCERGGKVVINIVVSATGRITKTNYNKAASNTTNRCLIDSAISYALKSRFNTVSKEKRHGIITYVFPGQY